MTAAEVLRRARALLETRGWTQHTYEGCTGRLCSVGALNRAVDDRLTLERLHAEWFLERQLGPNGDLLEWNDATDRTAVQVLMAFDIAVALAESEAP